MDDLLATHLPDLRVQLGGAPLWMVRYRNPELTDHLRTRVAAGGPDLASLLHLSFNRHRGIDREREAACLRLTRSAALAWRAAQPPRSDAAPRRSTSPP